jgi:hypothetical protein
MIISKVKNKDQQHLLLGAVIKLTDLAKSNHEFLEGRTLESILENTLSLFARHSHPRSLTSTRNKESKSGLRRGGLADHSIKQKKSINEHTSASMANSSQRTLSCSICYGTGHSAGTKCPVVDDFGASFVAFTRAQAFGASLGNEAKFLVELPDSETKLAMRNWLLVDHHEIPKAARHMLITRCFKTIKSLNNSFENNPVEVTLLEEGGGILEQHIKCHYPAHKVANWIRQLCTRKQRKHH